MRKESDAGFRKHRLKALILAATLILVVVGAVVYDYYQNQPEQAAMNALKKYHTFSETEAKLYGTHFELIASRSLQTLPFNGSFNYKNVTLQYTITTMPFGRDSWNFSITEAIGPVCNPESCNGWVRIMVVESNDRGDFGCIHDISLGQTAQEPLYDYPRPFKGHLYLYLVTYPDQHVAAKNKDAIDHIPLFHYCSNLGQIEIIDSVEVQKPSLNGTYSYKDAILHYEIEKNRFSMSETGGPPCRNYPGDCEAYFLAVVTNPRVITTVWSIANYYNGQNNRWSVYLSDNNLRVGSRVYLYHVTQKNVNPEPAPFPYWQVLITLAMLCSLIIGGTIIMKRHPWKARRTQSSFVNAISKTTSTIGKCVTALKTHKKVSPPSFRKRRIKLFVLAIVIIATLLGAYAYRQYHLRPTTRIIDVTLEKGTFANLVTVGAGSYRMLVHVNVKYSGGHNLVVAIPDLPEFDARADVWASSASSNCSLRVNWFNYKVWEATCSEDSGTVSVSFGINAPSLRYAYSQDWTLRAVAYLADDHFNPIESSSSEHSFIIRVCDLDRSLSQCNPST